MLHLSRAETQAHATTWPVGDMARLNIAVGQLVQWQVVRGWRAANYITALDELATASLIVVAVNIPDADEPERQHLELAGLAVDCQ